MAGHWHHGHGGFYGPGGGWGGQYYRPGPRYYGPRYYGYGGFGPRYYGYQNYGYQNYWYRNYGGWGGTNTYVYCQPWQGQLTVDAYGNYVCVRSW